MGMTLEELMNIRPGNPEAIERHQQYMLDEIRAYKLRELREALQLTQVALAKKLEVSQNQVSKLERGEITRTQVGTLQQYVEALGGTLRIEVEADNQRIRLV